MFLSPNIMIRYSPRTRVEVVMKNKEIKTMEFAKEIAESIAMESGMGALWEEPQKERRADIAEPMKEILEAG